VLVVGAAQSGCQIAEELYQNGRQVYLSTSTAARVPRRYRGKDIVSWLALVGFFDQSVDQLASPQAKYAGNPQVSGKNGGHSLNLHQFYRDGVILLGRSSGIQDGKAYFAPNLMENLARSDKGEIEILKLIDDYIADHGLDIPEEKLPVLQDGYQSQVFTELDLKAMGINTIIWAMGYRFDFSLVKLPVFDQAGYPIQKNCATTYPGLYFLGLPWLTARKSGLLLGVGEDAAKVAESIADRKLVS
jgi:putative flavoprotein involved in K+ transport